MPVTIYYLLQLLKPTINCSSTAMLSYANLLVILLVLCLPLQDSASGQSYRSRQRSDQSPYRRSLLHHRRYPSSLDKRKSKGRTATSLLYRKIISLNKALFRTVHIKCRTQKVISVGKVYKKPLPSREEEDIGPYHFVCLW